MLRTRLQPAHAGAIAIAIVVLLVLASPGVSAEARPTLYWGTRGSNVRLVQWKLSSWGYYRGVVDGVYGADTYRAVVLFQRKNGLHVDGLVGPATWRALGFGFTVVTPTPTAAAPSRSSNIDLIARVIAAESRGEPYRGQVAVGAVLLNRVGSRGFPKTVASVIFQPHALESVSNGLIWRRSPSGVDYSAARDAINGFDPSYGSTFFWNPAKPVSRWIWTRRIITKIGAHVFGV